jgi:hypothetical protein
LDSLKEMTSAITIIYQLDNLSTDQPQVTTISCELGEGGELGSVMFTTAMVFIC